MAPKDAEQRVAQFRQYVEALNKQFLSWCEPTLGGRVRAALGSSSPPCLTSLAVPCATLSFQGHQAVGCLSDTLLEHRPAGRCALPLSACRLHKPPALSTCCSCLVGGCIRSAAPACPPVYCRTTCATWPKYVASLPTCSLTTVGDCWWSAHLLVGGRPSTGSTWVRLRSRLLAVQPQSQHPQAAVAAYLGGEGLWQSKSMAVVLVHNSPPPLRLHATTPPGTLHLQTTAAHAVAAGRQRPATPRRLCQRKSRPSMSRSCRWCPTATQK